MARSTHRYTASQQAAVLGAMHNAVARRERLVPAPILGSIAPPTLGRISKLLAPQPEEDIEATAARLRAAGLIAGSGAPLTDVGALLSAAELMNYANEAADADCKFCAARASGVASPGEPRDGTEVNVVNHGRWTIDFDPDSRVTSVLIADYEFETTPSNAALVVDRANPQNWSRAPGGFFVRSQPGTWLGRRWTPTPWPAGGGDLLEGTRWRWNEQITAQIYNILRISDLGTGTGGISYKYSLSECIKSDFGFGWQWGGMDVDNGYYTLTVARSTRGSRVRISAKKAVRYAPSPESLPEVASLLNYLAPTIISLLMHELVYHSTDNLVGSAS
jgi:hypothetical protein